MRMDRGIHRAAALLTLCAAVIGCGLIFGCEDAEKKFDNNTEPTLRILASQPCGKNVLPVATAEEHMTRSYRTITVKANGTDPRNGDGTLTPGTNVTFFVEEPDASEAAGLGRFLSSNESESKPITVTGREARDQFYCLSSGTVVLQALIKEYRPGGTGEAIELRTSRRGFPVRCVHPTIYEQECGNVGVPDFGTDAGDGGVSDAGDATPTDGGAADTIDPPRWSLDWVPPDGLSPGASIVLGIQGSRRLPDDAELVFLAREGDRPLPNVEITFDIPGLRLPGVRVNPTTATTDGLGVARTRIIAGGTPGPVTVTARGVYNDQSDDANTAVVIRGTIPSHRSMHFVCRHPIIATFAASPDDPALAEGTDCTVQLADRVQGRLEPGEPVFFLTEAGTMDEVVPANEMGQATSHHLIGRPFPFNVEPAPYEMDAGYVERNGRNPRDGWVTLVAISRGEEDFVDTNGNKVFDGDDYQEPWMDLGEPFIDINDNGEWDPGEEFRDTNGDGEWTPPNGVWDAETEIWREARVLWVGDPRPTDPQIVCEVASGCSRAPLNPNCPPSSVYLSPRGSFQIIAHARDVNGNCPGSREQGLLAINTTGPFRSDGLLGPIGGADCWGNGGPLANPRTWTIVDTGPIPDPNVPEPAPVTGEARVTLAWEDFLQEDRAASWTYTICR